MEVNVDFHKAASDAVKSAIWRTFYKRGFSAFVGKNDIRITRNIQNIESKNWEDIEVCTIPLPDGMKDALKEEEGAAGTVFNLTGGDELLKTGKRKVSISAMSLCEMRDCFNQVLKPGYTFQIHSGGLRILWSPKNSDSVYEFYNFTRFKPDDFDRLILHFSKHRGAPFTLKLDVPNACLKEEKDRL